MWGGWYDDPELMAELEQKIRDNMDKLTQMGKASSKKSVKPVMPAAPVAPVAPAAPVTKASAKAKLDIAVDD